MITSTAFRSVKHKISKLKERERGNLRHCLVNGFDTKPNGKFIDNFQCWFVKVDLPRVILNNINIVEIYLTE